MPSVLYYEATFHWAKCGEYSRGIYVRSREESSSFCETAGKRGNYSSYLDADYAQARVRILSSWTFRGLYV